VPTLKTWYVRTEIQNYIQGFQPKMYELKFKSKGDSGLSNRVVELYKEVINLDATLIAPFFSHISRMDNPLV
jgi:aromatic ring-opening dioxygenase catalytic subunit (LigB family)